MFTLTWVGAWQYCLYPDLSRSLTILLEVWHVWVMTRNWWAGSPGELTRMVSLTSHTGSYCPFSQYWIFWNKGENGFSTNSKNNLAIKVSFKEPCVKNHQLCSEPIFQSIIVSFYFRILTPMCGVVSVTDPGDLGLTLGLSDVLWERWLSVRS